MVEREREWVVGGSQRKQRPYLERSWSEWVSEWMVGGTAARTTAWPWRDRRAAGLRTGKEISPWEYSDRKRRLGEPLRTPASFLFLFPASCARWGGRRLPTEKKIRHLVPSFAYKVTTLVRSFVSEEEVCVLINKKHHVEEKGRNYDMGERTETCQWQMSFLSSYRFPIHSMKGTLLPTWYDTPHTISTQSTESTQAVSNTRLSHFKNNTVHRTFLSIEHE